MSVCAACRKDFSGPDNLIAVCHICNDLYHANNVVEVLDNNGDRIATKNCALLTASEIKVLELKTRKPLLAYRCPTCISNGNSDPSLKEIVIELQNQLKSMTLVTSNFGNFIKNDLPAIKRDIACVKRDTENHESRLKFIEQGNFDDRLSRIEGQRLDERVSEIESLNIRDKLVNIGCSCANNTDGSQPISADFQNNIMNETLHEISLRKLNENKLIIYNVSEYKKDSKHDFEKVTEMLSKIDIVTNITKNTVHRLGRFSIDKKRPVEVRMNSHEDVIKVLTNWKSLPNSIYVSPSLTKLQRSSYTVLKKEAAKFNAENTDKNIKKIVKFMYGNPQLISVKNKSDQKN